MSAKYSSALLDKPNVKFEVLELYKLTQVQNIYSQIKLYAIVLELYKLTQVQNLLVVTVLVALVLELYKLTQVRNVLTK